MNRKLFNKIERKEIIIILPEIILPGVSSAIARGTDNIQLALEFFEDMKNIRNFIFIPVDREI